MSDIRITAKLKGGADVARLLRRHPEKVGRTLESLVKPEARGLAVELARNTRPFGFSEAAKKRGEKAVAGDVRGVFAIPSRRANPGSRTLPTLAGIPENIPMLEKCGKRSCQSGSDTYRDSRYFVL